MALDTVSANKEKKSLKLSKSEMAALKDFRTRFYTAVQCAQEIGIDRNVLDRVLLAGSGSPTTVSKIRIAIQK